MSDCINAMVIINGYHKLFIKHAMEFLVIAVQLMFLLN